MSIFGIQAPELGQGPEANSRSSCSWQTRNRWHKNDKWRSDPTLNSMLPSQEQKNRQHVSYPMTLITDLTSEQLKQRKVLRSQNISLFLCLLQVICWSGPPPLTCLLLWPPLRPQMKTKAFMTNARVLQNNINCTAASKHLTAVRGIRNLRKGWIAIIYLHQVTYKEIHASCLFPQRRHIFNCWPASPNEQSQNCFVVDW